MKLNFKDFTIDDKVTYEKYRQFNSELLGWEYSFAMTYIWNAFSRTQICDMGDMAFVQTCFLKKCLFYPPLLKHQDDLVKAVEIMEEHSKRQGIPLDIRGFTKEQADKLDSNKYKITTDRGNSDYIYSLDDLSNLTGKKFHSKRNFVNRFKLKYNYEFRLYDESKDKKNVLNLYVKWNDGTAHETAEIEKTVIKRALQFYKELNLTITVLYVDGNLVAFNVSDTNSPFIIHSCFEKADRDYEGSYQAINQFTAQEFLSKTAPIVNRQEDMNIEGLRKAKLSYNPIEILDKYRVQLTIDK